jgi:N-acyl homoserine lactone hydrolase
MSDDSHAPGVDCEVVLTGRLRIPGVYAARPAGGPAERLRSVFSAATRCPCLAFIVRHPTEGVLVIDTGLHPDAVESVRGDFGPLMGLFFAGLRPAEAPFDEQLRARGVEPREVSRVVMTHLHADHTSGMRLFPNARFLITRPEWKAARRRRASRQGYVAGHLPDEARVSLIDFGAESEPHGPFERSIDLLGDGSVRLLDTPGHTVGHMSVLLRLADERKLLVAGDAAYSTRNIEEQVLPLITADDERSRHSLRQIKAFADEDRSGWIIPSHDPSAWQRFAQAGGEGRRPESVGL